MDPLSLTGSIVGLLGAAGKVGSILLKVRSALVEAPQLMDQVCRQVRELQAILTAVNAFILQIQSVSKRRMSLIQVDQLVATVTELVLTFSELEALASSPALNIDGGLADRIKVAWKEDTIAKISTRLDRHKASLSLMLNIVQCESDLEAERSQSSLHELVEDLLESNSDISKRLQTLEDMYDAQSIRTIRSASGSGEEASGIGNESSEDSLRDDAAAVGSTTALGFWAFEDALHVSRVYQRTHSYDAEDVSFRSSTIRTHAWSVLSGLSLSQVSAISVVALPVYSRDVFNVGWYSFGMPTPLQPPTLPPFNNDSAVEAWYRPRCRVIIAGQDGQAITDINVSQLLHRLPFDFTPSSTPGLSTARIGSMTVEILDTTVKGADVASRSWWLQRAHAIIFLYSPGLLYTFTYALELHRLYYELIPQSTKLNTIEPWDGYVRPPALEDRPCMLISCWPTARPSSEGHIGKRVTSREGREAARQLGCSFAEFPGRSPIEFAHTTTSFLEGVVRELEGNVEG